MSDQNVEMHIPGDSQETRHAHMGPILAVLIIVLVLILGGLYLWGGMLADVTPDSEQTLINNEPETSRAEADQQIFETLSPSDELDAIGADLTSTNLDSLDTDMTTIDAELNNI